MTEYECYSLMLNAFAILTTIVIIIVAVWGERIRQLWNIPKLEIDLIEPTYNITVGGVNGWYYLLQVRNKRETIPAKNTRIFLRKVYKKAPDGTWHEKEFSGPTQVRWQWSDLTPRLPTIGPSEKATFGALLQGAKAIELKMFNYPNNLQKEIIPNDPTRLEFKAVSDTCESNTLFVEISWDGEWVEDRQEMKNHCKVKKVAK